MLNIIYENFFIEKICNLKTFVYLCNVVKLDTQNKTDLTNYFKRRNNMENNNGKKKKSVWDVVLKVVIAALSALAGALGANAVNL